MPVKSAVNITSVTLVSIISDKVASNVSGLVNYLASTNQSYLKFPICAAPRGVVSDEKNEVLYNFNKARVIVAEFANPFCF